MELYLKNYIKLMQKIFKKKEGKKMKVSMRNKVKERLESFGYSDDYILQSCAEHILEDNNKINQILIAIADDEIPFEEAIQKAMEKAEDERLKTNEYTVKYFLIDY